MQSFIVLASPCSRAVSLEWETTMVGFDLNEFLNEFLLKNCKHSGIVY